ncbi:coiled-coil domain-containing protein-domain-containing protein [Durotheca rogersii]|uniref:coiled-coil domain-containing protein-domain-containing protein n=1 Tax=Durotheca rogersii TaxID=419775 RepID=UPI00221F6B85|nr:coiled-coil domain-containing protein-domain-containing protein [Durotheca rogersii]KAI5860620.1 coiled-coil domain-containing protein-domain-containing protein [Durotheca rogersii]
MASTPPPRRAPVLSRSSSPSSPPPPLSSSPTAAYVHPRPRPPKSPAHSAQIRVQNRRREYLERNPGYFDSLEHELTDPVLYDALIRRFQSPAEREKEGREKGYSRMLEVDLIRGEAKLAQLTSSVTYASVSTSSSQERQSEIRAVTGDTSWIPLPASTDADVFIREYANGDDDYGRVRGRGGREGQEDMHSREENGNAAPRTPKTKEEGHGRWVKFLRRRFVLGRDDDFDYRVVDEDDALDIMEQREQEDAWFDDEDPGWASGGDDGDVGGSDKRGARRLEGETGVQDF